MKKATITSIECIHTGQTCNISTNPDDVFLRHQTDGGEMFSYKGFSRFEMDDGQSVDLKPHLVLYYNYGLYLGLFDNDGVTDDTIQTFKLNQADLLCNVGLTAKDGPPDGDLTENNGAIYRIYMTVTDASF